ncbi:peptidyl-prolyl isomerase [Candidatus Scalindua japonica]|uniref:Peptidyl-prolyl cis-trans isomerase n=1 Tax=Candidatus Scalindua japonica TaxID=1284222 RepID=A0A286U025_9BACT|nr:FKBP-type peptidyl-prolyl cis-trans isomerase [Candidatus Scalindua japonica]GAX61468.1 peptidyl-prolyl isomerase [Candidatus Scalindua japonica]
MKLKIMLFSALMLFIISGITTAQEDARSASTAARWSESQKMSYILGTQVGNFSKQSELEVSLEILTKGLNDVVKGSKLEMTQDEINAAMGSFQQKAQEKLQAARMAEGTENIRKGLAFLGANKKKAGVKETASGLQYKVITMGEGAKPKATDKVKVHYSGTLIDGKEFDSSYKRNQPAEFGLNQVIKGWTEGVQLMNVGSKYEFYIPSRLAYGLNGPASIGPNQTLIFTVELLDIATP